MRKPFPVRFISSVLCLILLLSCTGAGAVTLKASAAAGWQEAYAETLRNDLKKDTGYVDYNENTPYFSLIYVNSDSVPELLYTVKNNTHTNGPVIYTYSNGKAYELGGFGEWGACEYLEKEGYIKSRFSSGSMNNVTIYKMNGTKVDTVISFEDNEPAGEVAETMPRYINDVEVPKDEYHRQYDAWMNRNWKKTGYDYVCNETNIKNILKTTETETASSKLSFSKPGLLYSGSRDARLKKFLEDIYVFLYYRYNSVDYTGNTVSSKNMLSTLLGDHIYEMFANVDYKLVENYKANPDPRGAFNYCYTKTNAGQLNWILRNLFNYSDSSIRSLVQSGEKNLGGNDPFLGFYEKDGYYYHYGIGGIGGPVVYRSSVDDIIETDDYCYVEYTVEEIDDTVKKQTKLYAQLKYKTTDGISYWSLYRNSKTKFWDDSITEESECESHVWTYGNGNKIVCKNCAEEFVFRYGSDSIGVKVSETENSGISSKAIGYTGKLCRTDYYHASRLIKDRFFSASGGHSFGFALLQSLMYADRSLSSVFGSDTPSSIKLTEKFKDAVILLFESQFSYFKSGNTSSGSDRAGSAEKLINEYAKKIKENSPLPVVCFRYSGNTYAAAVLGILDDDYDKDYYWVIITDCSNPGSPCFLKIRKDFSEVFLSPAGDSGNNPEKAVIVYCFNPDPALFEIIAPGLKDSGKTSPEEDPAYRNTHVVFIVTEKGRISISSADNYLKIEDGIIKDTSFKGAEVSPVTGTDLIKVTVDRDGDNYKCSCDGEAVISVNSAGIIGTAVVDGASGVEYGSEGTFKITPEKNSCNYKLLFYKEGLVNGSDTVGTELSGNSGSVVFLDCSDGKVNINCDNLENQKLTMFKTGDDTEGEDMDLSGSGNGITVSLENGEYVVTPADVEVKMSPVADNGGEKSGGKTVIYIIAASLIAVLLIAALILYIISKRRKSSEDLQPEYTYDPVYDAPQAAYPAAPVQTEEPRAQVSSTTGNQVECTCTRTGVAGTCGMCSNESDCLYLIRIRKNGKEQSRSVCRGCAEKVIRRCQSYGSGSHQ